MDVMEQDKNETTLKLCLSRNKNRYLATAKMTKYPPLLANKRDYCFFFSDNSSPASFFLPIKEKLR